jgi:hypothetical protein
MPAAVSRVRPRVFAPRLAAAARFFALASVPT